MKKYWLFLLIVCFSTINCIAQDSTEVLLHIPEKGKEIKDFIPKGYRSVATAKGDFNKDGREDKVIVLEQGKPNYKKYPGFDRTLIILFRTKTGWELAGRSDKILYPANLNNDPMMEMDTKGNTLELQQVSYSQGILTNFKNTLRYWADGFYLSHRTIDSSSIQVKCEKYNEYRSKSYLDIDYVTGVRVQKKISYYCELLVDKKDTLELRPLIKLSEVKPE
jgi:hypothetical protein